MARPAKQTVDYFSHDADASESRTLSIIFNNFGHDGISCWWQLLERISKTRNHVITLNNGEDTEFLAAKLHFQPDRLLQILNKLASLEAIDSKLWSKKIIWSQNFVDRLKDVYKSRKQDLPLKPQSSVEGCIICGNPLVGMRSDAKYCSDGCRQKAHRVTDSRDDKNSLLVDKLGLSDKETPLSDKETPLSVPEIPQTKLNYTILNNIILPDYIDKDLWNDFLDMRKKLRKPATDRARELLLKDLEKLKAAGDDPNEVIKQSIKNSWAGLFPLKEANSGTHRQDTRKLPARDKYTTPEEWRAAHGAAGAD